MEPPEKPGGFTPLNPAVHHAAVESLANLSSCTNDIDDDCDDVVDFDCAVPVTAQLPLLTVPDQGIVVSGNALTDLGPLPDGNQYLILRESYVTSTKQWLSVGFRFTVPPSLQNVSLDVYAEGLRDNTTGDSYVVQHATGDGTDCPNLAWKTSYATAITISGATEPGALQSASIGASSAPWRCIRLRDTIRESPDPDDTTTNELRLDRLFLMPH